MHFAGLVQLQDGDNLVTTKTHAKVLFGVEKKDELQNILNWMIRHDLFRARQRDKRFSELLQITRTHIRGGEHDPLIPVEVRLHYCGVCMCVVVVNS